MPSKRGPTQINSMASLSPNVLSGLFCFVCCTGPLSIYYGFQSCVYGISVCANMCLYVFLMLFFFDFFLFVLRNSGWFVSV